MTNSAVSSHKPYSATASTRTVLVLRLGVILAFIAVHIFLFRYMAPYYTTGTAFSDVDCYRSWAFNGLEQGECYTVKLQWVYPLGAMLPFWIAAVLGYAHYTLTWLIMLTVLNAAAVVVLSRRLRSVSGMAASIWWLLVTCILAPVAVARIDGITAPMGIIGMVLISSMPLLAGGILALATWIKIWPASIILSALVASKSRLPIFVAGISVSCVIAIIAFFSGMSKHLFGFITEQNGRAMQVEAVFNTPTYWVMAAGSRTTHMFYNGDINTIEASGPIPDFLAPLMQPLLLLALLVVVVFLFVARKAGAEPGNLIPLGSFALASAMIVFNKVGSPQFVLWLVAICAVGLATDPRLWRAPAALMVVVAAATTAIYPVFYDQLFALNRVMIGVLTFRNAALIVLFGWSLFQLYRATKRGRASTPLAQSAKSVKG